MKFTIVMSSPSPSYVLVFFLHSPTSMMFNLLYIYAPPVGWEPNL